MKLFKVTWWIKDTKIQSRLFTNCDKAEAFVKHLRTAALVILANAYPYKINVTNVEVDE